MKKLLTILCLIVVSSLSTKISSEEYICSYVVGFDEVKNITIERREGSFVHKKDGFGWTSYLYHETEKLLILTSLNIDNSVWITIINKKNNEFFMGYNSIEEDEVSTRGKCIVRN